MAEGPEAEEKHSTMEEETGGSFALAALVDASSLATPTGSPSLKPTAAAKKRRGIDGLDLDDNTVYSLGFDDQPQSKLRPPRKAAEPVAAPAAAPAAASAQQARDRKRPRDSKKRASAKSKASAASAAASVAISAPAAPAAAASSKKRSHSKKPPAVVAPLTAEGEEHKVDSAGALLPVGAGGEFDPATVMHSVHADLAKERQLEEQKRQKVRLHRNKPITIPRDAESKNLYAQRYRLLQERLGFIKRRHCDFYLTQIVDRYPTPRFPYLDQRNLALWQPDAEARRHEERCLADSKRRIQEETIARILKQEAVKREALAQAKDDEALGGDDEGRRRKAPAKKKGKAKVMPIAPAEAEESATHAVQPLGRQTQNSLADSLALETALLLSSADAPHPPSPTPASASSTSHTSPTDASTPFSSPAPSSSSSLPTALSSLSFTRTTPLLRVGNFILYDNPDLVDWEPARIVAVNRARTRMRIEAVIEGAPEKYPTRKTKAKEEREEAESTMDPPSASVLAAAYAAAMSGGVAPSSPPRWIDLDSAHFFEYIDVVWAKVKGFDWWPAELCEEVENGVLAPPAHAGQVHIAFCGEARTVQLVSSSAILPYLDYREANATNSKMKKKGFEDSFNAAEEIWRTHMWQAVLEESDRREREAAFLHRLLAEAPSFYFGKRVAVFWPLDEAWYSGVIKQYNLATRKHCILYDDDAVEWIDVCRELVVLAPFALAVHHDSELPTNPALIKSIYKTYAHQQYELRDNVRPPHLPTIVGRDFLPDFIPRSIEQVIDSTKVTADPPNAKLVAHHKSKATTTAMITDGTATAAAAAAPALDLATLNCWECGLDLERWNGPGLLSSKYGGSSNPNRKEGEVEVISCGRCTKVVHSFCLKLMLKRKNQTEHALPAVDGDLAIDEAAAASISASPSATDAPTEETAAPAQVLPKHLLCSVASPRCPDCLRCECCALVANKSAAVEDLVTCDICQMRVHLQCIDPSFDPTKHQRPTDGWVCTLCVQCRCCSATHSLGGHSHLPLPPPPGEAKLLLAADASPSQPQTDGMVDDAALTAASSSPDISMMESTPPPTGVRAESDGSERAESASPDASMGVAVVNEAQVAAVAMDVTSDAAVEGTDVPAGVVTADPTQVAAASTAASATAVLSSKRKKAKKRGWSSREPARADLVTGLPRRQNALLPFSKRFTSKWADTDEDSAAEEEPQPDVASSSKKVKTESGALVVSRSKDAPDGADLDFWSWTNSFTVCQPCGYRLEKRKYCPICVVIYDRHTVDPMVQCDSCQRWVHIACDPNAQANEAKLTKDNTQYHCSECLRRERSNELTTILDELVLGDKGKSFLHPVNEHIAPDYFLTIKTPMDFTTIYTKLMELQYQGIEQFTCDLNLIWRNAKDYNPINSNIHKSAVRLQNRSTELFKQLTAKHSKGGLFDQTIGRIEDQEEERRKAEVEREAREADARRKRLLKRQHELQHPRPPRLDYYAFFLSFDDVRMCEVDACLLCGSAGDGADLVFCIDCGECAHSWCLASNMEAEAAALPGASQDAILDTALFADLTAEQRANFRCPNCQTCVQCGAQEKKVKLRTTDSTYERVVDSFATCTSCSGISHVSCVPYLQGRAPKPHEPFKCPKCVSCRCCQATTPGRGANDKWSADYTLCASCAKLYASGSVCPVCDMVYKPRDESTPMMCCDGCSSWIHMQCDGLKYEQYIALTQDASKKYYCPGCRHGNTPAALAERADKDAARRLITDRKRAEKNKLHNHIAFHPTELPRLHSAQDLMHTLTHLVDRLHAHQNRMAAQQRHQAVVLINQAIIRERAMRMPIPPLEAPKDLARFERQSERTFQLLSSVVATGDPANTAPFTCNIARLEGPMHAKRAKLDAQAKQEQDQEQQAHADVEMQSEGVKTEATKTEAAEATVKLEPIEPVAPIVAAPITLEAADVAMVDVPLSTAVEVKAEPTPVAVTSEMPPLDGGAVIEMDTSQGARGAELTALIASSSAASTAASAAPQLGPGHPPLTAEQALSYLVSEGAHASRAGDWRVCAFCHKTGDQESSRGEGRLLPALCFGSRWVHVQCALWTDRVSTNIKGQMNVLAQMHKLATDSTCSVCSLPGASLRCKRGLSACGKYHFACALARNCLFTIDKEFHCELHSSSKRAQERQAVIDKISRRLLVKNNQWNQFGLFAMRSREVNPEQEQRDKSASPEVGEEVRLSREDLAAQEALLTEAYSDYEDTGDGIWKRRKLTFASKQALQQKEEATRAQGAARNDEEDTQSARPLLPLAEREEALRRRNARVPTASSTGAADGDEHPAPAHDSDDEQHPRAVKDESEPTPMDLEEDAAAPPSGSGRSSRAPSRRERDRERDRKRREAARAPPPARQKEIDRLQALLPAVAPSSTVVFLRVGALSVTQLGELVPEARLFHDAEYLYPLGYTATRLYWSYKRPGERAAYACEVLGYTVADPTVPLDSLVAISPQVWATTSGHPSPANLAPLFRITASDDASQPIIARSAPLAWAALMKHFPSFGARNAARARMRSGDTFCWSLGGSAFFGLSVTQVTQQVEQMPRADQCTRYRFRFLQRMLDLQRERAEERAKLGLEEGEELPVVPTIVKPLAPTTVAATLQRPSPALLTQAQAHPSGCARTHGFARHPKPPHNGPGPGPNPPKGSAAALFATLHSALTIMADDPNGLRRRKVLASTSTSASAADRRPLKDIPLPMQYRMMKASAPRARVAHSVIHEWGLFANQDLEEGAMVIEYLGELIRPRMADVREKFYEDTGEESCYMFRIDDDEIVDSTKRGNISRFINHSCDPNCRTLCIDSSRGKKIVVLAARAIAQDEEITYDYFFASENEKIRCNCGAINCAGRLN